MLTYRREQPERSTVVRVENEISSHDLLKHIGFNSPVLRFIRSGGRMIKQILFDEVCAEPTAKARCEKYAQAGWIQKSRSLLGIPCARQEVSCPRHH